MKPKPISDLKVIYEDGQCPEHMNSETRSFLWEKVPEN